MPEVSKLLGFGVFWRPLTDADVLINGGAVSASVAAGTVGANELGFGSEGGRKDDFSLGQLHVRAWSSMVVGESRHECWRDKMCYLSPSHSTRVAGWLTQPPSMLVLDAG